VKRTTLILLLAGAAGMLRAQDGLTLEECLGSARERNRSLTAAMLSVKEAEAQLQEARARRLPSLTIGTSYSRLSPENPAGVTVALPPPVGTRTIDLADSPTEAIGLQLDLQYPLFAGFRVSEGIELARLRSDVKLKEYELRGDDLAFEILRLFWETVRARDMLAAIDKNLELVKIHAEEVRRFAAAGLAVREDALKVEMRTARTELLRIEAESGYELALLRLKTAAGIPRERQVRPEPPRDWNRRAAEATAGPRDSVLQALIGKAFSARREFSIAGSLVRMRESAKKIAEADYYPSILVTGNYTYAKPNGRIFPPPSGFEDTWQVGVAARIDIGGFPGTAARTAQASALEDSARNDYEALRERIVMEVTERYLGLKKAEQSAEVARTMKAQAEESLKTAEEKFKNGLAKSSDVLEEQNNLLQAELAVTGSTIDRIVAEAALKRAVGEFHGR